MHAFKNKNVYDSKRQNAACDHMHTIFRFHHTRLITRNIVITDFLTTKSKTNLMSFHPNLLVVWV